MSASGMERLARAMSIWLAHRSAAETVPPEQLLAEHDDLRDLLEPLIRGDDESEPAAESDEVTLADFRIVREIGRGGMGIVYEALQLGLDRRVALKLLPPAANLSPRAIARFKREAITAARLDHPGIVAVLAVGDSERGHWFAMDLVDGVTLDEYGRSRRAEHPETAVRDVVAAVASVAEALAHAHEAGVIHRDIKPSNVIVRPGGEPVLTDFGVARESALPSMTQTGEFAGTPFYVSPEQAAGRDVDARSDVFSLGVTLYELLTRRRPFDGSSSREVLDQIVRADPPSPDRVDRELPRDLSAIVLKALEKDPDRRYPSAAAMAADLRRFLTHRPVQAQPLGVAGRLRRWTVREPLKAALAATLLVATPVVAGLMAYVWWSQPATDIGRDALRTTRVEELLLDAIVSRLTLGGDQKQALVAQVLELAPDDPYVLANAALYFERRPEHGPARALELLRRRPPDVDDAGLHRVVRYLERKVADPEAEVDRSQFADTPESALDAFVLSYLSLEALGDVMGDREQWKTIGQRAVQLALRAIGQTGRPRSQYFEVLNRAGRCVGDAGSVLLACDAMTEHWPQSVGAWIFRTMAWEDMEPDSEVGELAARRSLELSPDNFVGLITLAQIARRRGDAAEADELWAKAGRLYPDEMRWRERAAPHVGK